MFGLGESDKNNDMTELPVMWLYLRAEQSRVCSAGWMRGVHGWLIWVIEQKSDGRSPIAGDH